MAVIPSSIFNGEKAEDSLNSSTVLLLDMIIAMRPGYSKKLRRWEKNWKKVLFVPTGALLSKVTFHEGQSVPGIAHGIVIESV